MKYTTIKIEVTDDRLKPAYATSGSAAVDLCARVEEGADRRCAALPRSVQRPKGARSTEGLELRAENTDANATLRDKRMPGRRSSNSLMNLRPGAPGFLGAGPQSNREIGNGIS